MEQKREPRNKYLAELELQMSGENNKFLNISTARIIHTKKNKRNWIPTSFKVLVDTYAFTVIVM
jgi:hypothetical protein